jgi:hypothetical protein
MDSKQVKINFQQLNLKSLPHKAKELVDLPCKGTKSLNCLVGPYSHLKPISRLRDHKVLPSLNSKERTNSVTPTTNCLPTSLWSVLGSKSRLWVCCRELINWNRFKVRGRVRASGPIKMKILFRKFSSRDNSQEMTAISLPKPRC